MSVSPASRRAERISRLPSDKRALFQQRVAETYLYGVDHVARSLSHLGFTHVYGVAGVPTERIFAACDRRQIRPLGVYHQTAAVCMAAAQNYQSGRLVAATLVSAGPAVTNAITGLAVAYENGWPAVVLGGRRTSFQECDLIPMVRHVTKHAVSVSSTDSIGKCICESYQIAMAGRPGPVYVELQESALAGRAVEEPIENAVKSPRSPLVSNELTESLADVLVSARRPALILGKGVRWTVSTADLRDLVETLGLPFITSPMGRGFIPDDHPLCFNLARTDLQTRADVVLVLGARLNWMFRHGAEFRGDAHVIRVDIQDKNEDDTAVPTKLIHADAGDLVRRVLGALKRRHDVIASDERLQQMKRWQTTLQDASEQAQRSLETRITCDNRPMTPYRMMKEVRDALPREAIFVADGNISMLAAQQVIPAFLPASRMDAGTNGCMGVGIPFAIGAKVTYPERPVVVVTGDYAFSLSAMELETCVRHQIPITVVVANNQGNAGALKQRAMFPAPDAERVTMFQPDLEYHQLMQMFGGQGKTITDPQLLKPALTEAISSDLPCCINVATDPNTPHLNAWVG